MSDTVIQVENVSKQYRLGKIGTGTISRDINRWWQTIRGKEDPYLKIGEENDRTKKGSGEFVWALKNINFSVKQGDVLGIIGRNGAGKSTLLKILSRTTAPTTGAIKIKGRVASLLEVGTGFHPDLSGRDNIYLNGAIMGMTKQDIKSKFDEIVDFAGVERYIDTPVKRYSSGMYVRLAFAVAAHLEPEILIVDEVLAVGDAEFQKKCLGKMKDVSVKEGRTVLFVSHNIGAITQLTNKALLLQNGCLLKSGETEFIIEEYLQISKKENTRIEKEGIGNSILLAYMCDGDQNEKYEFKYNEDVHIKIRLVFDKNNANLELAMRLIDKYKNGVFTIHHPLNQYQDGSNGSADFLITIPANFLTPNSFSWIMCINHPGIKINDLQEDVLGFKIVDTGSDFLRHENQDYGTVFGKYSIIKL